MRRAEVSTFNNVDRWRKEPERKRPRTGVGIFLCASAMWAKARDVGGKSVVDTGWPWLASRWGHLALASLHAYSGSRDSVANEPEAAIFSSSQVKRARYLKNVESCLI